MTTQARTECAMCARDTGRHRAGNTFREEKCGCTAAGMGLLPNPWHVHYCPVHAEAPAMLALLRDIAAHFEGTDAPLGMRAFALLARVEGGA